MRLSAYKKAIDEAASLPKNIPELENYFKNYYSPRDEAFWTVITAARLDVNGLYPSSFWFISVGFPFRVRLTLWWLRFWFVWHL